MENIPREKHKLLADRIETILLGSNELLFSLSPEIESVAKKFAREIIEKGFFSISKTSKPVSLFKEIEEEYQSINIKSNISATKILNIFQEPHFLTGHSPSIQYLNCHFFLC